MTKIHELIHNALHTGYLSLEAEAKLRQAFKNTFSLEELDAFMSLQLATMAGRVRQESLEFFNLRSESESMNSG